jgi:hypothetical protein
MPDAFQAAPTRRLVLLPTLTVTVSKPGSISAVKVVEVRRSKPPRIATR